MGSARPGVAGSGRGGAEMESRRDGSGDGHGSRRGSVSAAGRGSRSGIVSSPDDAPWEGHGPEAGACGSVDEDARVAMEKIGACGPRWGESSDGS